MYTPLVRRVRWARVALVGITLSTVACVGSLADAQRERDVARAERDTLRSQLRYAEQRESLYLSLLGKLYPQQAFIQDVEVSGSRVIPVLNPVVSLLNLTAEDRATLERVLERQ